MTEAVTGKRNLLAPLLIGLISAIALGGGAFFAVAEGWVLAHKTENTRGASAATVQVPSERPTFVPLDPLLVSIARTEPARQLRFEATLEVAPDAEGDIRALMPRIMDVANTYLRATELSDLRDPASLMRIRSQMLRRIQVITESDGVHDLLVTKFLVR